MLEQESHQVSYSKDPGPRRLGNCPLSSSSSAHLCPYPQPCQAPSPFPSAFHSSSSAELSLSSLWPRSVSSPVNVGISKASSQPSRFSLCWIVPWKLSQTIPMGSVVTSGPPNPQLCLSLQSLSLGCPCGTFDSNESSQVPS